MTRREKHMTMLDLAEDFLLGDDLLTREQIIEGIAFVRGRGGDDAPPWWAEVIYELRAQRREDRESAYTGTRSDEA